jgi:HPt (histidine-containing phosphotransfer) domain-containing protein
MSSAAQLLIIDPLSKELADVSFDRLYLVQHTMESPELEREIIDLFLAQLPDILGKLLVSKTPEEWKFQTHTLKGSALAVGAFKIGALARTLEMPEHVKPTPERTTLIHKLQIAAAEFEEIARRIYRS